MRGGLAEAAGEPQQPRLAGRHRALGQRVDIAVDMLPGTTLHGHVASLAPASSVSFSPIAPDNATGNFTKVVQRLPVKIVIDPGQEAARLLKVGMSVTPTVALEG